MASEDLGYAAYVMSQRSLDPPGLSNLLNKSLVGRAKAPDPNKGWDIGGPWPQPNGIGDVKSDAKGSGARFNSDKPDFSLIPLVTLEDEARVWEYGKRKYAAWNWAKGMPWSVPFACIQRHMAAWQRGEDNDPESGLPHMAHVACNVRMLLLYSKNYQEGDDRPKGLL
jgi:hypothetical protein